MLRGEPYRETRRCLSRESFGALGVPEGSGGVGIPPGLVLDGPSSVERSKGTPRTLTLRENYALPRALFLWGSYNGGSCLDGFKAKPKENNP